MSDLGCYVDIDIYQSLPYSIRMSVHTLRRFDDELTQLKECVLSMGGLVERAIGNAVKSMLEQDEKLARETIHRDTAINELEIQCDNMTRGILVRRQPAANDLRFIIAIIKVVTDLERMGDLAANVSGDAIQLLDYPPDDFSDFEVMGGEVQQQVYRALDALSRGDIHLAMSVIEQAGEVEKLCKAIDESMLARMLNNPDSIHASVILSNAARNLKRIADHTTNIAEMVVYNIYGHDIRHVNHEEAGKLLLGNI